MPRGSYPEEDKPVPQGFQAPAVKAGQTAPALPVKAGQTVPALPV